MKLIGTIQPFGGMQSIHLYDDNGNQIEYRLSYLNNYAVVINNFINDYPEITELNLHGPNQFCTKVKDEIEGNLLTQYNNKNRIEVKII